MRYLVTGGAGFIGSHLTEALLKRGDEIIVLDDFSTGSVSNLEKQKNNPKLKTVSGSILDKAMIKSLLKDSDGCFHMAAAVGVEKILRDPIGSIKTNIHGTENVLDLCAEINVPVLLASTSEIYGKNSSGLLNEESDRIIGSPLLSRWTYAEAKALDESYAKALHDMKDLRVKIIRYFNTVGPRQSSAYGMVIPTFFKAALANRPITIHGDGSQQRIFCHVNDAIAGTILLWDASSGDGEAFNLGGLEEITILDLAKRIIELTNSNSEVQFIPYSELRVRGFEDMSRRLPDSTKIKKMTGWQATADLENILGDYFTFVREQWN